MPRYIAFLRAINVGGRVVKMDRLRELFETMGLTNVETFIASGNVIFDSTARKGLSIERLVEDALRDALGYDVDTFVRTPREVAEAAEYQPFADMREVHSLSVGFMAQEPSPAAREAVTAYSTEVDQFHVHGRELYWLCRVRVSESKVTGPRLEKVVGMPSTMRNITTVRKLAAKYAKDAKS
jgi:uncharacterized protein (DUF1697 family)